MIVVPNVFKNEDHFPEQQEVAFYVFTLLSASTCRLTDTSI